MNPDPAITLSDETIRKLQSRLRQVAYRQMGNLADDLVQETLFIFFENLHQGKYRGGDTYPEYFCYALGILKVIIIKEIKKKQKLQTLARSEDTDAIADFIAGPPEDSGEHALMNEEQERLNRVLSEKARAAFKDFPTHIQQLIYLHVIEEWSYTRLASHFGISKQTLVSRFNSYIDRMRKKIDPVHTKSKNEYLQSDGNERQR